MSCTAGPERKQGQASGFPAGNEAANRCMAGCCYSVDELVWGEKKTPCITMPELSHHAYTVSLPCFQPAESTRPSEFGDRTTVPSLRAAGQELESWTRETARLTSILDATEIGTRKVLTMMNAFLQSAIQYEVQGSSFITIKKQQPEECVDVVPEDQAAGSQLLKIQQVTHCLGHFLPLVLILISLSRIYINYYCFTRDWSML